MSPVKIKYECLCSGCRIKNAPYRRKAKCFWGDDGHRYRWRYIISIEDQRLVTSMWFGSFAAATKSGDRKYAKLAATITQACS